MSSSNEGDNTEEEKKKAEEEEQKPETSTSSTKNVTYDEKGDAIYTDEATKYKYRWCKNTNQWKPFENEHYTWNEDTQKWIPKVETENEYYRWCTTTNQWIPKMNKDSAGNDVIYSYDEKSGCHTYTDKDGVVFIFDKEKKAWFPKVDDDFLAVYQLNYGFVDNTTKPTDAGEAAKLPQNNEIPLSNTTEVDKAETSEDGGGEIGKKRKATQAPPKWFEVSQDQNTKVYVSNLPLDITEDEFAETMSKCGMIMKDIKTGKLKIKLYRDSNQQLKGDGLCHYIRVS
jgi:HIV Tat-specific factor 1